MLVPKDWILIQISLLAIRYFRLSVNKTSFQIETYFLIIGTSLYAWILHYDQIYLIKIISLNRKNAIYSSKHWLIISCNNMGNIFIKHRKHFLHFITWNSFDDKPVIMGKKEKTSTRSCSFSRFENSVSVSFNWKRFLNLVSIYTIYLKNLLEFLLLMANHRWLNFQVHTFNSDFNLWLFLLLFSWLIYLFGANIFLLFVTL